MGSKPVPSAKQKTRRRDEDKAGSPHRDVGGALRSVFQQTVDEGIPPEMLDLLGKLD